VGQTADYRGMHLLSASSAVVDGDGKVPAIKRAAASPEDEIGRIFFEESPLPMIVHELGTLRCVAANAAALALYGYSRDELLELRLFDVQPSVDEEPVSRRASSSTDGARDRVFHHRKKDGTHLDVEVVTQRMTFRGLPACLDIVRDVTERGRDEAFAAAQQRVLEMIATCEPQPVILAAITRMCEDESPGMICSIEVLPLDPATARRAPPAAPGASPDSTRMSAGAAMPTTRITRLLDPSRRLAGIFSVAYREPRDRSARDRRAAAIGARFAQIAVARGRSEDELRLLRKAISQLSDLVIITEPLPDASGWRKILFVNEAFERLTGYTRDEAAGKTLALISGPKTSPEALERTAAALDRWQPVRETLLCYTKDRREIWLEVDHAPIADESGRPTHWVSIQRDVSERKALEEQLLQAQKMEAVGRLAGGIAHDFNNMLSVVIGYGDLALTSLHAGDPLRADLEEIKRAAQRTAVLTRQLLAFSRKQVLQPRVLDLNEVVTETERMLRRLIGEDIELALGLAAKLSPVVADPGQIQQVVMNLVVNARDAMPKGGRITVETANVTFDEDYARAHSAVKSGPYVLLAVSDNGAGMDAETRRRIFEPFFTTKDTGKGTGLGLSTVYGIVQQSGGDIRVYSEPGRGTTFRIHLPVAAGVVVPARPTVAPAFEPRGTETILLVEDADAVRSLARKILEKKGYKVLEARNCRDAHHLADTFPGTIHLMLSDVVMPYMDGHELADRVRVRRPSLSVLFMSGYTEAIVMQKAVLEARTGFLQKPFTPDALTRVVRGALDGVPAQADAC
jgi:PAS domain S-box-containing protein